MLKFRDCLSIFWFIPFRCRFLGNKMASRTNFRYENNGIIKCNKLRSKWNTPEVIPSKMSRNHFGRNLHWISFSSFDCSLSDLSDNDSYDALQDCLDSRKWTKKELNEALLSAAKAGSSRCFSLLVNSGKGDYCF